MAAVLPALAAWRRRERDGAAADGWRYRVAWEPVTGLPAAALAGTWLVVLPQDDPGGTAAAWAQAITGHGARVVTVTADAAAGREELAGQVREVLAGLGREVLAGHSPESAAVAGAGVGHETQAGADAGAGDRGALGVELAGVVSLLALGEAAVAAFRWCLRAWRGRWCWCRRWVMPGAGAPLWVLTRGAVAAGAGEVPVSPAQAQVWGLGRVAALEHPDRWGGLVDLPR